MKKKTKHFLSHAESVIKDWNSRWYARNEKVGDLLVEDMNIRNYLKKTFYSAGIPKIDIERNNANVRIYLYCARPSVVIGKGSGGIKKLESQLVKMIGRPVNLRIVKVYDVYTNAQLVAENITRQLENRISFQRAMKNSIGRAMRAGATGIKTVCSGHLDGTEARTECYQGGTIPLQTLRADIDYGFAEATTTYGRIGVKVWIYKGNVLPQSLKAASPQRKKRKQQRNTPLKKPQIPPKPPIIPTKPKSDIQEKGNSEYDEEK